MIQVGLSVFHSKECFWNKSKPKPLKRQKMATSLRDEVLALDRHSCRFCGTKRSKLDVHHVIYRSGGGKDVRHNLLTLCSVCHDVVHSDRKRWQPLCLGVVWLRDVEGRHVDVPGLEKLLELQRR